MTLRVAFVGGCPPPGRSPEGGVEIATSRLALALAEAGVEVTAIAPGQPGGAEAEPAGIVRIPVDMRLSLLRGLRPWRRAVASALRDLEPAIVHAHGLIESGIAAIDAGVPSVVSVHGNHAMDTRAARKDLGGEARILLTRRLALRVVRRADAVVSVHPSPEVNLPARPARFVYIPTIVDDAFRAEPSTPVAGRVLFCGGARRIKGLDLLAAAWPDIVAGAPGASLEIVGWPDGEQLPAGLDGARARGLASAHEVAQAMAHAAVVVVPSRFEVAPITLLEAWTAGVPVVATRVGGVPALADGAAVLVEPDPSAIAAGLVAVLDGSAPLAELVAEGHRRAEAATATRVAQAHIELYEELVS
jgi:glycosyltransferase involved in cell wall biosynthesis